MKTSYILIGIVIAVVVIGGVFILQSNNNSQAPSLSEEETVVYGDEGYSPKEVTIKKGEAVTFKNESSHPGYALAA